MAIFQWLWSCNVDSSKVWEYSLVTLYLVFITMAITYSTYSNYKATNDFTYPLLMSVSMALLSSRVLLIHQFVFFSDEIHRCSPFGGLFCSVVSFLEPLKEIRVSALSIDEALSDWWAERCDCDTASPHKTSSPLAGLQSKFYSRWLKV